MPATAARLEIIWVSKTQLGQVGEGWIFTQKRRLYGGAIWRQGSGARRLQ